MHLKCFVLILLLNHFAFSLVIWMEMEAQEYLWLCSLCI